MPRSYRMIIGCLAVGFLTSVFIPTAMAQESKHRETNRLKSIVFADPTRPNSRSTVVVSEQLLIVRDSRGHSSPYRRVTSWDTRDGRYQAYYSAKYRQAIRWPVAGAGIVYLRRGLAGWKPARMRILALPSVAKSSKTNGINVRNSAPVITGQTGGMPEEEPDAGESPDESTMEAEGNPEREEGEGSEGPEPEPTPPPEPKLIVIQRVPGEALAPVTVVLKNPSKETLIVRIVDTANANALPIEVRIAPGRSLNQRLKPMAPDFMEQIYLVPDNGGWKKEVVRTMLPATQRLRFAVFRYATTYRFINRLRDRNPSKDFQRKSAVGLGAFTLTGGESLTDGMEVDVYRLAARMRNPGATGRP